jgi:ParB family transcriptional regulator, chromosome partitioning protein
VSASSRGLPERQRMRHDRHFVDELARRMGEGIGRLIPVESIAGSQDQPRSDLGDLGDLTSSVSTHGVLEPLLVRPRPNAAGYELVSGQRRLHAAIAAGLSEVPCIELHVSDQAALEIALIENLQREDLSSFEEAEGFQTLITKYGYTHEQVALAVGRSRVTVTETLKLLDIPREIRDECRHADISAKGILLEIAKAGGPEEMRTLARAIVERRLDRDAVRRLRQDLASAGTPQAPDADSPPPRSLRPFVLRYRHPDQRFSFALSFRSDAQPDPGEVIAALEELIVQLREDAEAATASDDPAT